MRIYLDDERNAPDGWIRAYLPEQVIECLKIYPPGAIEEISLDHDLGFDKDGKERTGYEVLLWIEKEVALNNFIPPKMYIHSQNSVGIKKMNQAIEAIQKMVKKIID